MSPYRSLDRFYYPQAQSYSAALCEIQLGRKRSHWMWYIFPQLRGLVHSRLAMFYGIADIGEAQAYLADPVLGPRLLEISRALLDLPTNDPLAVLGSPDNLKLRSCMTLFREADPTQPVFQAVLDKFYGGEPCHRTLAMLQHD